MTSTAGSAEMPDAVDVARVALRDGSVVLIRPVRPADAALLADGFVRLSAESRWLRFLTGKSQLSAAELRYFTEVDHHQHEALAALDPVDGRGLGIARYIRRVDEPEVAEIAVTVADDWQGRGLGTELLGRLTRRAIQEGIRRFTALVAADNVAVVELLHTLGPGVRVIRSDFGTVEYEVELDAGSRDEELQSLLRAFGRRQLHAPKPIQEVLAGLMPDRFAPHVN